MKKITFILLVSLISGTAFAQDASATANAAADIVSPLQISPQQDLNFGKVSNNAAGTVIVASDGTFSESTLSQIGNTNPTAASFDITAANGFSYKITLPVSVTLSNGTEAITVDEFNHDAGTDPKGSGSAESIGVGATLNVDAEQPTGNYTGTFDVSVAYE
jgi:hypothetical protein